MAEIGVGVFQKEVYPITSTRQPASHFSEEFMVGTLTMTPVCMAIACLLCVLRTRTPAEDSEPGVGLTSAPWPQAGTWCQNKSVAGMSWGLKEPPSQLSATHPGTNLPQNQTRVHTWDVLNPVLRT